MPQPPKRLIPIYFTDTQIAGMATLVAAKRYPTRTALVRVAVDRLLLSEGLHEQPDGRTIDGATTDGKDSPPSA